MDNNLCIIPARGGSKRIPRKNIKDFLGKPIIAYSIAVALKAELFTEVMVSTDDIEIEEVSKIYGAKVPFMRSAENADDYATTLDVVKEVLANYKKENRTFNKICIIYPTAPLIRVEHLIKGYQALKQHDAAIPVTEFSYPVWRSFKLNDGLLAYQWPEYERSRSQDLPKLYHDAGQWYWIKTDKIEHSLVPADTTGIVLNNRSVQDIDTEEDWELAETKYRAWYS